MTFQDELYVLIRDPDNRIQVTARSADASTWTEWTELPGGGRTDTSLAATVANQSAYLIRKGIGDKQPYINVASSTGTWSGWDGFDNPGETDTAYASAGIGSRIYLFSKGIGDHALYVRRTI
jgi:hypothetical protein